MLRISNLIGGVSGIRVIDLCSTPCLSYDRGRGREQEGVGREREVKGERKKEMETEKI